MMPDYLKVISDAYTGYWHYLISELSIPSWHNYFYALTAISLLVWLAELLFPWRVEQPAFRKGFFTDLFYMYFNFFLFPLLAFNALSSVVSITITNMAYTAHSDFRNLLMIDTAPTWIQITVVFVVADFIQWLVHRLLHRVPWLWQFHKLHHSVKEMGFAAHLRFHWMETIVYKSILYIPLAMIGTGIEDFFLLHMFTVLIGHLNHANIPLKYGPFKFILNNPAMHIWHHAKSLPDTHQNGVNFGISLSIWDYLFSTAYIPENGRDIELGFKDDETFPDNIGRQLLYPL